MATSRIKTLIEQSQNIAPFNSSGILEENKVLLRQKDRGTNRVGNDVNILDLSLTTSGGETISLLGIYKTLFFEEGILSSTIAGQMELFDSEAIFEKFAIRGGEIISIKIEDSNSTKIIIFREDLIVDKVESQEFDGLTLTNSYLLHFSSRSFVTSLKKNIFKSYTGNLAEAVYTIYREMSQNDLLIENPRITIPNDKPYISTGINPHRSLHNLASRASTNNKLFVFFERTIPIFGTYPDGTPFTATHYFGSIQKLMADARVNGAPTIVFSPKLDATFEEATIRASRVKPFTNYPHIQATNLGMYTSDYAFINPITRSYDTQSMSYISDNISDFYENKLVDRQNPFIVSTQKKQRRVSVSAINEFTSTENWLKNRTLLLLSNNMFKMHIDIQGSTNEIGTGHIVNLIFPSRVDKILSPGSGNLTVDQILSGKYVVQGVKHFIADGSYMKTLTVGRGSSPYNFESRTITDSTFLEFLDLVNDKLRV
jgi:hypothetical protein